MSHGGIRARAFGGAVADAFVWRQRGQTRLTVVVKVALRLLPDRQAEVLPLKADLCRGDVHYEGHAGRSVHFPSDFVPMLQRPEILLTGHARSPHGSTTALSVRLYVGGDASLLDKTVHVYGDRSREAPRPAPFVSMPLVYERAAGGPSTDNPVGVSTRRGGGPNVVDASDPHRPAGFGPIPMTWPARAKRVVSRPPGLIGALLDLPDDLPMSFFQSAPSDQWVERLSGDEWIVVDGMDGELDRLQSQLPGLVARARMTGTAMGGVPLVFDRLHIDMDERVAYLGFRGSVVVQPAELKDLEILAGVEVPDEAEDELSNQTVMLDSSELSALSRPLPFAGSPGPAPKVPAAPTFGLPFGPHGAPLRAPSFDVANEHTVTADSLPAGLSLPSMVAVDDEPSEGTLVAPLHVASRDIPFAPPHTLPGPSVPRLGADDDDDDDPNMGTVVAKIVSPSVALPFAPSRDAAPARRHEGETTGLPFSRPPAALPEPFASPRPTSASRPMPVPPITRPTASAPAPVRLPSQGERRASAPAPVSAPAPRPTMPQATPGPTMPQTTPGPTMPQTTPGPTMSQTTPGPTMPFQTPATPVVASQGLAAPALPISESSLPRSDAPPRSPSAQPPSVAATPSSPPRGSSPLPLAIADVAEEAGPRKLVIERVRAGEALYGMDLSAVDLRGLDLSGGVFSDANLTGAQLAGTKLVGARFGGARLVGADLSKADLRDAELDRADLSRATLVEARFDGASLMHATLASVVGDRACFENAKLDSATLAGASFIEAVFDGARMPGADLSGAKLNDATFRRALLGSAKLAEVDGEGAIFAEAELDGASLNGAVLRAADFVGVRAPRSVWERATLDGGRFSGATLSEATFERANVVGCSFERADLTRASFSSASADGADFTDAKMTFADLRQAKLSDATLVRAVLTDANGQKIVALRVRVEGADLRRMSLRSAKMKAADFSGAIMDGTDLRDADLEGAKLTGVDRSRAKLSGANLKGIEE